VAATIKAASGSRERSRRSGGGARSKSRGGEARALSASVSCLCVCGHTQTARTAVMRAGPSAGLPAELRSLVRSREGNSRGDGAAAGAEGLAGGESVAGSTTPRPVGTPDSMLGLPGGLRAGALSSRHTSAGGGGGVAFASLAPGTARVPVTMTTVLVAGPDSMLTSRGVVGDAGGATGQPYGSGLPPRPGSKAGTTSPATMGTATLGSPPSGAGPGRVPTLRNLPPSTATVDGGQGSARGDASSRKGVTSLLISGPGLITARTGESVDGHIGPYTSRTGSAYDGNPATSGRLDTASGAAGKGLSTMLISGPGDISTTPGYASGGGIGGSSGLRTVPSSGKLPPSRWTTEGGPGIVQGRLPPVTAVPTDGTDAYAGERRVCGGRMGGGFLCMARIPPLAPPLCHTDHPVCANRPCLRRRSVRQRHQQR